MTNGFLNHYADSKALRLLTGFICFSLLVLPSLHALAAIASPTGASIPAVTEIVDASGAEWTVSDGVIYKNGAPAGFSKGVAKLLYIGGVIYQENASGNWWSWSGATWVKAINPLSPSLSGASIPTVGLIVDPTGSVWTVSGGIIYKDGALAGFSKGVVELLYKNGIFYQENMAQNWWSWNGVGWIKSSNPVPPPVNGSCGSSNNANVITAPSSNLCTMGTATTVTGNGPWTWGCSGANGGTDQTCQANLIVNGSCGSSNNANVITAPSSNLCTMGTATTVTGNGPWTWGCSGANGGTNQTCQANLIVNGSCGTSDNASFSMAPTGNLCTTGTATTVTGNGPWTWGCYGSNGGNNSSCSANLKPVAVNGTCNPASNGQSLRSAPTTNLCTTGTATTVTGNGPWAWSCHGSNGGNNSSCTAFLETQSNTNLAGTKLGINIGGVKDSSDRQMMFVDVMKNARVFETSINGGTPVPVDANGWPTTDFETVFITAGSDPLGRPVAQYYPSMAGTYSLSFTGQALVSGVGCCQIESTNYDAATNTTTADVVVSPTGTILALKFANTNNGVQNIQLLRPGYPRGTTQIFTTQFLNAIKPFAALRFMDALSTNSSPVTSWAERTQPTAPSQAAYNTGVAWEYLIELANESGKDIWINIPEGVDLTDLTPKNYVVQLAQLLKDKLNPSLHVYVEYSNELWNTTSGFSQFSENLNAAVGEVSSGADTTLNYDGINNKYYWGYRRVAHQIVRISQLFAKIYGQAAINNTIRPVFESQFAQPHLAEDGLAYIQANFGAPKHYIYGVGAAGYYGPTHSGAPYETESAVIEATQAALAVTEQQFEPIPYKGGVVYTGLTYKGLANYYGLKYTAYEGGPSLNNSYATSAINETAESDSAQPAMIESLFANFFGCGGDLFMFYSLAEPQGNVFGALEDLSIMTPKYNALLNVANTPLANYNTCQ